MYQLFLDVINRIKVYCWVSRLHEISEDIPHEIDHDSEITQAPSKHPGLHQVNMFNILPCSRHPEKSGKL